MIKSEVQKNPFNTPSPPPTSTLSDNWGVLWDVLRIFDHSFVQEASALHHRYYPFGEQKLTIGPVMGFDEEHF